jgi:dienelactone hydrolase
VIWFVFSSVLSSCGAQMAATPSTTPQHVAVTVTATTAPPGVTVPGARWIKIRGAGGDARNEQIAAVFRPPGQGPFPLVVELHGSGGLKDVDIEWAAKLATAGFVTIAGCWQPSIVPPYTAQFNEITLTFIACPNLSPGGSAGGPLPGDFDAIDALIAAGRMEPGVRADAVGLYGMSAGGGRGLDFLNIRHDIGAAVLDSPGGGPNNVATIRTPILVLAGTADENVPFTEHQAVVAALQQAGKDVEWHYYQGGRHALVLDPVNKTDAAQRIIDFLKRHVSGGS